MLLTVLALAGTSCQQVQTTSLGGFNPLYHNPDLAPLTFPPGVTPPGTTPVQPPAVTLAAEARFSELLDAAAAKVAAATDFHCTLVRREVVDGELQPQETLDFMQRFRPHSLRLEWVGDRFGGRKMAYVAGANDDKVQVRLTGIGRL